MECGEHEIIDLREEELDKGKVINRLKFSGNTFPVSPENVLSGMVKLGAI